MDARRVRQPAAFLTSLSETDPSGEPCPGLNSDPEKLT